MRVVCGEDPELGRSGSSFAANYNGNQCLPGTMSVPEGHGKMGRAQPGRRQGATHSRSASRPIAPALEVAAAGEAAALSPAKRPRSQHGANSGPESRPEPTAQAPAAHGLFPWADGRRGGESFPSCRARGSKVRAQQHVAGEDRRGRTSGQVKIRPCPIPHSRSLKGQNTGLWGGGAPVPSQRLRLPPSSLTAP